ncbi:ATP-binding protein [Nocardia spumae]|uniref:ATP-binding protein n=1 Tax=Nocardia spumae TaxID=2887190 RepID=UPI001D13F7DF|nr:LuxR C-terminal-related transcriptional regulator [Nocardia spumae]
MTSFIDRRAQMAEVGNRLASSRLVTLTGIGGVGKTRLALRVAHKVKHEFAGGAWLVELGDLRDENLLVDVVAAAVGLRNRGARPILEMLIEQLSPSDLLLVLDNCEQVIDAVTELAESLLRTCPNLRILATSREALGLGGESVFAVPPMAIPGVTDQPSLRTAARFDAVTLFAERAAAAVPGFAITDDNRLTVARICARLDGLPLAIELAAARLRTMSPEQILSRLDDRFTLLTRGSRGAPKRQQTLRWSIGWSYDLCTSMEQRLWNQLSVFAGGFELDAAADVCDTELTEWDLHDALAALVDKSVLIRDETEGTIRFRMLETVQEYGRDKAEDSGDYLEYVRRHRDWCERLTLRAEAEWIGPHQVQWFARLERELPNLRKALELGLAEASETALRINTAIYLFWVLRGRLGEGRRWCERVLDRTTGARTVDRAKALYGANVMAAMQGDLPAATDRAAQLTALAEQTAEPLVRALATDAAGNLHLGTGDGDPARIVALLADAVDIYESAGDVTLQLDVMISLGWVCALQGDTAQALGYLDEVLAITASAGETMFHSWGSWAAGFAVWRNNEPERAAELLRRGLRAARTAADPLVAAGCLEMLAWIAAEQHNPRRAAVLMGAADSLGRAVGGSPFMFQELRSYREKCASSSRAALGVRAFDTAGADGAAMSFDTAVGFALGEPAEATEPRSGGDLTKRERQVADLVAQGLTNKAIATRLVISPRTAEGHVEHILAKLGFSSRAQIAAWATAQPGP